MDIVYTYLDGEDPSWISHYAYITGRNPNDIRHHDHGELAFAIWLCIQHCSWIRKIHIVYGGDGIKLDTLSKIESYLELGSDKVNIISQDQLLSEPTFSSCMIEGHLHKIPNITDIFLYANDDMFIGKPLDISHFIDVQKTNLPFIDMSARFNKNIINMAQLHSENAWNLFKAKFPNHKLKYMHAYHFTSIMCKKGCEMMHEIFGKEIKKMSSTRSKTTINLQVLAALISFHFKYAICRTQSYKGYNISKIMIENETEGFNKILTNTPHHFCINGMTKSKQIEFNTFMINYKEICLQKQYKHKLITWFPLTTGDDRNAWPKENEKKSITPFEIS